MALTGSITERRDVPHEEGNWFEFRQLSWTQLKEAREARGKAALRSLRDTMETVGGETFAAMQKAQAGQQTGDADAATQSLDDQYDRATLLRLGIHAWSYPEPLTEENIGRLDEATALWAMGCLLGIHVMSQAASEEARGNGYARSMPH